MAHGWSRRKVLTGAGIGGAAALLAACGATPTQAPAVVLQPTGAATQEPVSSEATSAVAPGEKAKLLYWSYLTYTEDSEAPILKAFDEAKSDIDLSWEYVPWEQYWQKLGTTLAAGNPPDVWNTAPNLYFEYILRRQLTDITERVKADYNFDNWHPAALSGLDLQGRYYGVPRNMDLLACYFNKTLFDQAGVEPPPLDGNWTWDDYLEKAAAIVKFHNKGDRTLTWGGQSIQSWINLLIEMESNGGQWWKGEFRRDLVGMEFNITDPPCCETLKFDSDLINTHKVAPPAGEFTGQADPFLTGQLAITQSYSWSVGAYQEVPFEWNLTQVPKGKVKQTAFGGCDGLVMSQACEAKEGAWSLMRWLIDPETGAGFLIGEGVMPARRDKVVMDPYLAKYPDKNVQALADAADKAGNPFALGSGEWGQALSDEFDKVYLGNTPAEEGCASATRSGNAALDRIRKEFQEAIGG